MAMTLEGEAFRKSSLRDELTGLLRERRFEDALALLYKARAAAPSDAEILTAIDQLKEFLVTNYAKRLGGMDRIAPPLPAGAPKNSATMMIAQFIDGRSTFADIAQVCPLGQLRTLQVLVELYIHPTRETEFAPPLSGLRQPSDGLLATDELQPDTARSAAVPARSSTYPVNNAPSVAPGPSAFKLETEEDRRFKELFGVGTAAFIQHRFKDAVDAFEECMKLRPEDKSAEVMLRRSLKDHQEQNR